MSNRLIHLYHGAGKGKTTAAMGLAVRALGCGRRVVIVQFLKGGATGELEPLQTLGATFYRGKAGQKFVFQMNEEEKAATRARQTENLRRALYCALYIPPETGAKVCAEIYKNEDWIFHSFFLTVTV